MQMLWSDICWKHTVLHSHTNPRASSLMSITSPVNNYYIIGQEVHYIIGQLLHYRLFYNISVIIITVTSDYEYDYRL